MRAPAVLLLAAALLVGTVACSDDDDPPPQRADEQRSSDRTSDTGDEAQSEIEIAGGGSASSSLERRVSRTLSELHAKQRGSDTVITLPERVLFAFGEHELLPEATSVLDRLVEAMELYESAPVQVNGHTDAVGSDAANQALSERRAQAVVDYLVAQGIAVARLQAQGFGETQLVVNDPGAEAENRRVEIVLEGVTAG